MLDLTVQGVRDFSACERFYDYRHRQEEYEAITAQQLMAERFHNILVRVVSFFFYKKQSGITPSYNALLNRWERLWFPKDFDATDITREQHTVVHGNLALYSNIAALGLMKLYEDFGDRNMTPLLINEQYLLPIDHDIRFRGTIDLVIRNQRSQEVYTWSTEKRRPSANTIALELAATKMAYEYRNPRQKDAEYFIYDLGSSSPGAVRVDPSMLPTDALKFWIKAIKEEEIFPSRRGMSSYCKGCSFDSLCANWKGWSPVAVATS